MSADREPAWTVTIKPIPRPCKGCGVGEAQSHIFNCPAVLEALREAEEQGED